ncbi:MAG TPA: glycosyltransferase [Pirellulaceae bacterium]|nr:glycosyltransferase [Pirellulaceae bacterium]HMO90940.1 glycosyltransferase [Pirellulaceae bacterium]HMP69839.1 glycosyltransferase [Pirellulaceae bacterium]
MVFVIGFVISATLIVWALGHLAFAYHFTANIVSRGIDKSTDFQRSEPVSEPDAALAIYEPPATVLMALRGFDPTLRHTLEGLLKQNYSDYEVIIVIDHQSDAAWHVVEEITKIDAERRIRHMALQNPHASCSLKCSSLIQAYREIRPETEVLALLDADVVPHANWLRDLVAPLANPQVGVATGNKFYSPSDRGIGSSMRSLWNAGAIVPTALFSNPWAGTCALRVRDVEAAGLIEIWKTSAVDDGPIRQAFKPLGLAIHFEPKLVLVNRDPCTFGYASRYVSRMLTWSKMYETTFWNTLFHMIVTLSLMIGAFGLLVYSLASGAWATCFMIVAAFFVWNSLMLAAYLLVRRGVAISAKSRGERLKRLTFGQLLSYFCLLPIVQVAHGYWTLVALNSRKIQWRDVTYRINGAHQIEMVDYQPYQSRSDKTPSRVSI